MATTHFAVAPRFEGKTSALSYAFNYEKQGVACYLKSFYLKEILGCKAIFKLEIGMTHGLQAVIFEKKEGGEFLPLQTIHPVQNLPLTLEDFSLRQGINRYRVRLALENGGEVLSQVEVVHFLEAHRTSFFRTRQRSASLFFFCWQKKQPMPKCGCWMPRKKSFFKEKRLG